MFFNRCLTCKLWDDACLQW